MTHPYRTPGQQTDPPKPQPKLRYGNPDLVRCGIQGHAPYAAPITHVQSVNAPPCDLWHCPHCLAHVPPP